MNYSETNVTEGLSKETAVMFKPPSVCLLLLSGLPGAGKSKLSQAMRQQLRPSDALEILSVVELDDFIQCPGDGSFSPEAWRVACEAAREATVQEIRKWSDISGGHMRFILFIDTLPYRSMRAVYWRICRDFYRERESGATGTIGMLEVRLNVPVAVCLQRNENRVGSAGYIPPYVIKSMAAVFDNSLLTSVQTLAGTSWIFSSGQSASTWPVLTLCGANEEGDCFTLSAGALARQLLDCLLSAEIAGEMSKQVGDLVNKESKRKERAEQQQKQPQSNVLHELDMHMRALVRNYMADRQAAGKMNKTIGRQVSAWREEHYSNAKRIVQLQSALSDEDGVGTFVQKAVKDFEHKLALSWFL